MDFKIVSEYKPTGDQPQAIEKLVSGLEKGDMIISLAGELENSKSELQKTVSALEEKRNALETLNSGVLKTSAELPTMSDGLSKCTTPAERVAFLKSGKYAH